MKNTATIRVYEDYFDHSQECSIVRRLSNLFKLTKSSAADCEYVCVFDVENSSTPVESTSKKTHRDLLGGYAQFEQLHFIDNAHQFKNDQTIDFRIDVVLDVQKQFVSDERSLLRSLLLALPVSCVRFGAISIEKSSKKSLSPSSTKIQSSKSVKKLKSTDQKRISFELLITSKFVQNLNVLDAKLLFDTIVECLNKEVFFKQSLAMSNTTSGTLLNVRCGKFMLNETVHYEKVEKPQLHIENLIASQAGHFIDYESLDEIVKRLLFSEFAVEYKLGGSDLKEIFKEFKDDEVFNLFDFSNNFRDKKNIFEFFKFLTTKSKRLHTENTFKEHELNASSSEYYKILFVQLLDAEIQKPYEFLEHTLEKLFEKCPSAIHLGVLNKTTHELYVVYTERKRWFYNAFEELTKENSLYSTNYDVSLSSAYQVVSELYSKKFDVQPFDSAYVNILNVFDRIHSVMILDEQLALDVNTYKYTSDDDLDEALKTKASSKGQGDQIMEHVKNSESLKVCSEAVEDFFKEDSSDSAEVDNEELDDVKKLIDSYDALTEDFENLKILTKALKDENAQLKKIKKEYNALCCMMLENFVGFSTLFEQMTDSFENFDAFFEFYASEDFKAYEKQQNDLAFVQSLMLKSYDKELTPLHEYYLEKYKYLQSQQAPDSPQDTAEEN